MRKTPRNSSGRTEVLMSDRAGGGDRTRAARCPATPARVSFTRVEKSNACGRAANRTDPERFAREILPAVSRTFALSIRVLPGELGRAVLAAYLLCRIADTLEDEPSLPADAKAALLDQLERCFDDAAAADAFPAQVANI